MCQGLINKKINDKLSKNYKLNEVNINEQTTFKNGIVIDRDVVIDGHGVIINATDDNGNKVRIFNIENANVTLIKVKDPPLT